MNSEKVKEIKKVLEQNTNCLLYDFEKSTVCKVFQCKYILDYINELESEDEQLKQLREVDYKTMTILRKANTELNECMDEMQDRIAELEKENETKTDTIIDLLKKQELYETEKLKQFATILKVKTVLTPSGWCVNIEDIDETLKAFINSGETK